jgi:hypothetical protein
MVYMKDQLNNWQFFGRFFDFFVMFWELQLIYQNFQRFENR